MGEFVIYIVLFFFGTVFGSFVDVLVSRTASGKSLLLGRSECEKCLKKILPIDLIPMISYILLRGKCRYCKAPIPKRLFIVELSLGLLFILLYLLTSFSFFPFIIFLLLSVMLFAIFLADIRFGIIPDKFLLFLGVFIFLFLISQGGSLQQITAQIGIHVLAGIVAFLFFLGIFFLTKGKGMGFGDVKFAFFIGFLLSFSLMIASFYIAFLTGAAVSIILIVLGKKRLKKDTVPFGPFLVFGTLISLLFEIQMVQILSKFFGF